MKIPEMQGHRQRQLQERKVWRKQLIKHVKPGKIVEFGCGSGFVLEKLSWDFEDSIIVGVDTSKKKLEEVVKKNFKNVIPVRGDFTRPLFVSQTFDTAVFVGSLHEVFSYHGGLKVKEALHITQAILKDTGVLIIQDFLKPPTKKIEMCFKNEETKYKFLKFVKEFRPRKVNFRMKGHCVNIDITDAVEFISKYRSPNEEDWKEEMSETHFFFTEDEFMKTIKNLHFTVRDNRKLKHSKAFWSDIEGDVGLDFQKDYSWIQMVLAKK